MSRLLPLLAIALLAGCGGDNAGFTAEQFVAAVNERGAALVLGPELRSSREDAEVYGIEVGPPGGTGETHGGGSIVVMSSDDAGFAEYERCEKAASLLCFRADNVVLLLEGDIPDEQLAALTRALQALAEDTAG